MTLKRRRYSDSERARILAAVERKGLTYAQASKKFGVSEVTIWKWRRGRKPARERGASRTSADGSLAAMIRSQVSAKLAAILPDIVREEVASYLTHVFRGSRGPRARL
jgi:transposase-like protein